jgi:very-short-patch-repair endonuclease
VTNSLQAVAPEVADLWHPTKNGDSSPEKVIAGANKKIWWKCPEGPDHEWEATANSLVSAGSRCPCCAHQKLSVTNSLSTLYPNVAAEWHPTKNGDLTPDQLIAGTHKRVWWQCLAVSGHEWSIPILNRTANGSGCPDCTLTPRSAPEMRLAHELTAVIDFHLDAHKLRLAGRLGDIDILIEGLKLAIEFDGAYWHRNKAEKDLEKTEQIEDEGWKVIRVRERPLESIHTNDVMVEPLTPVKDVADLVLKQIEKVTETKIPNLETYLASKEPWREKEALAAIRAYQAERAAAKAERAAKRAARSSKKI